MNCVLPQSENIKEIEDIINIQKASGIFHVRQLGYSLPEETVSAVSFNQALGLGSDRETFSVKKKSRKYSGAKFLKGPADLISWPSDSDITVLRMNLLQHPGGRGQNMCKSNIPGDGLHLPNSSSMVNLATLMPDSQSSSKHSLSVPAEEYLLPLSSWEPDQNADNAIHDKTNTLQMYQPTEGITGPPRDDAAFDEVILNCDNEVYISKNNINAETCRLRLSQHESNSSLVSLKQTGSRVARFMRLYFCPCCTCLYQIENRCEQNARCAAASAAASAASSAATERELQAGDSD